MRIFFDTNVLISSLVFGGRSGETLIELLNSEHELYASTYVDAEFKEKVRLKWPSRAERIIRVYDSLEITRFPSTYDYEANIRDPKDAPVLNDALACHADVLLTGDKDFLESGVEHPVILSIAMLHDFLYGPQG